MSDIPWCPTPGVLLTEPNILPALSKGLGEGRPGEVGTPSIWDPWVEERKLLPLLRCWVNRNFTTPPDLGAWKRQNWGMVYYRLPTSFVVSNHLEHVGFCIQKLEVIVITPIQAVSLHHVNSQVFFFLRHPDSSLVSIFHNWLWLLYRCTMYFLHSFCIFIYQSL